VSGRSFFDTNLLIYADDADAGAKGQRARALIQDALKTRTLVLSTQVLQEYFVVATRKLGLSASHARQRVELYASLDMVSVNAHLILEAIDRVRLHHLSFWDALIIGAASAAGCKRVFTEDLNAGQLIDGVTVENPFSD